MDFTPSQLAAELVAARRNRTPLQVPAGRADLTAGEAMQVQSLVRQALGETAPASKIGIDRDGRGIAAPIFGSSFVTSGASMPVPFGTFGIEVEIAVRLGRDLTPALAAAGEPGLLSAIDGFFVGIEIIGSRLADRKSAPPNLQLADNLNGAGYILNADRQWPAGTPVDGVAVEVEIDGALVYSAPAVHPFGGALVVLERYARAPLDDHGCLGAGHLITTGSLCGGIDLPGPCRVTARLGGGFETTVEFV